MQSKVTSNSTYLSSELETSDAKSTLSTITSGLSDTDKALMNYDSGNGITYKSLSDAYADTYNQYVDYYRQVQEVSLGEVKVNEQESRRALAESGQTLGTGGFAIKSAAISQSAEASAAEATQTIAEEQSETLSTLYDNFVSTLESIYGEYENGTFAKLSEYATKAQYATTAVLQQIIEDQLYVNGTFSLDNLKNYNSTAYDQAKSNNYIYEASDGSVEVVNIRGLASVMGLVSSPDTDFELTDAGLAYVTAIINAESFQDATSGYNGSSNMYKIAKRMVEYSLAGTGKDIDELDADVLQKQIYEMESFFYEYSGAWRAVSLSIDSDKIYNQFTIDSSPTSSLKTDGFDYQLNDQSRYSFGRKISTKEGDDFDIWVDGHKYNVQTGEKLSGQLTAQVFSKLEENGIYVQSGEPKLVYYQGDPYVVYIANGKTGKGTKVVAKIESTGWNNIKNGASTLWSAIWSDSELSPRTKTWQYFVGEIDPLGKAFGLS